MSTIAIHHPDDPKRPKVIPAERFDPARHRRWTEGETEPATRTEASTGLPENFPARDQLHAADIRTIHGVRAVQDLDAIPGIGQKREATILAYLADLEDDGEG